MAAKTHAWKAACACTVMLLGSDAAAQEPCTLLCTPSLKVEPTVTFAERKAEFELIVAAKN